MISCRAPSNQSHGSWWTWARSSPIFAHSSTVPGRPLESRKLCPRMLPVTPVAHSSICQSLLREPPWPEPARGEDSGRCRHPAREVGRAIHYRLKPAVQRDAGRMGLRAVHVRGGNLVGLATATSTHILHLEKASLCAAPAWLCSQRMRDELGQRAAACPGFEGTRFLFQYPVDYFDLPHDL